MLRLFAHLCSCSSSLLPGDLYVSQTKSTLSAMHIRESICSAILPYVADKDVRSKARIMYIASTMYVSKAKGGTEVIFDVSSVANFDFVVDECLALSILAKHIGTGVKG